MTCIWLHSAKICEQCQNNVESKTLLWRNSQPSKSFLLFLHHHHQLQIVSCVEAHQNKVVSYQPNCCVEWIQCSWHPTTSSSSAYCWPPIMSLRATTSKILQLIIMYCSPTDGHWYSHYSVTGIRINPILGKKYMYIDVKIETIIQHAKYSNTPSVLWSFKICATSQPLDFLMSKLISLSPYAITAAYIPAKHAASGDKMFLVHFLCSASANM